MNDVTLLSEDENYVKTHKVVIWMFRQNVSMFFTEINALNARLAVLGREAKTVIGEMLNS